jgi:short-subunit dehydrogenase
MQFTGQVCVVTGAASGIGRALALELARRGAQVVVSDIDLAGAQGVVEAIERMRPGAGSAHALDVTDADAVAALVAQVVETAGIAVGGDARDLTVAHWRKVVEVNLMGVIHGADAAFKAMAAQGHGHLVNISSLSGLIPFPTNAPYGATKHAVVGLSHALRIEGEDLGVKVSVVCPGFIDTNIFAASEVLNADRERLMAANPFKKVSADEAAQRILEGVEKNRAVIIFPLYAHLMWALFRLTPALLTPFGRRMIRDFRKLRR